MFDFLYISFFLIHKMLKNLSTKYHQKNKESLRKNARESYEDFSKKEKNKNSIVLNDINLPEYGK